MSLIKVVHVTFDMRIGGAERVICNLIENTDRLKYDVSILCLDQPIGPLGLRLKEKGYQIDALSRKPGFDLSLIGKVRNYIISHNVDVLHCHQYTPYVYGLLGGLFTRRKIIFTEHGRFYPDQQKLKRALVNPLLSRFTDRIIAISAATREALVEYENISKDRIGVIYNGIEDGNRALEKKHDGRKSLGIGESAFVMGTVARLDSIKNHPMMIKGLKGIQKAFPDTYLVLVGDGPERAGLETLVAELGLSSRVIFTGFREDTAFFYGIMDVFLLTSFSEGTAMTLLEAMAASLPCIVTNVGGNPEIVRDVETGFIIPSDDEKVLVDKIGILLRDKRLIEAMGKAGRKRFEENFTVAKMVREYEKIYEELTVNGKQ